jgi:trehalose 6-phosphate synthase/phosphatase
LDFDASYWAHEFMKNLKSIKVGDDISDSFLDIWPLAKKHFAIGERHGLFLDYDGTLREFEKKPGDAFPHQSLEKMFDALEEKFLGKVYIISGRSGKDLKSWMGHRNFTLISEHGYSYCLPGEDEFHVLKPSADFYWKDHVREVLHYAVGTTPGSFVEEKRTSLVWHYRSSDPEYGKWKAQQLVSELYEMSSNIPVEVHHGKKIVEVSSIQVNKGIALEELMLKDQITRVICIGDDMTDESMFRLENENIMSIKVGLGETLASYRIKHPEECRKLIRYILDSEK